MAAARIRLDKLLVDRGLVQSRDRAQRLILAGVVYVGSARADKPGHSVPGDSVIDIRGEDIPFVSRGGVKLAGALDTFALDVRGRIAADIGAATGGFTDCLLQRGAARVYAIDVGYGQLAWRLRTDPRVVPFERANIRHFDRRQIPEAVDLVVIDVSFISLKLVLPAVVPLLHPGATVLPMVKPQFEVGKGQVGRGGVVRDPGLQAEVVNAVREAAAALGLEFVASCESPLPGPKGNREFFLHLERRSAPPPA